jgi:UDP-N-acetylmuramyl pentapeptide phosphotransferase/UDP-N-acetylglucosamine-1-phosphate transferase
MMYHTILSLALLQLAAFLSTLAGVPLAKRLARCYGLMAIPQANSQHQQPTALLGGVAIVGAFLGAAALTGNLP